MNINIASWNINSVRLRISLLKEIVQRYNFDVLCLQETKTPDQYFPVAEVKQLGYPYIVFRGEKSYNGVAILSKIPIAQEFFWNMCDKNDKRHIAVKFHNGFTLHNFYVPAGGDIPDIKINDKFAHKLSFIDEMTQRFSGQDIKNTAILGDFNIAPLEQDVWSHKQLLNVVSHTPVEVEKLNNLRNKVNWIDTHRYFVPAEKKLYSWWSYRARDWQKSDRGRRLDHLWITPDLTEKLQSVEIYKDTRGLAQPSDHAVISASLQMDEDFINSAPPPNP